MPMGQGWQRGKALAACSPRNATESESLHIRLGLDASEKFEFLVTRDSESAFALFFFCQGFPVVPLAFVSQSASPANCFQGSHGC